MRNIILNKLLDYYIPQYGNRFLWRFNAPHGEKSPFQKRADARLRAAFEKQQKRNPGKWNESFKFDTLSDEDLIEAFEKIVRVCSKQM